MSQDTTISVIEILNPNTRFDYLVMTTFMFTFRVCSLYGLDPIANLINIQMSCILNGACILIVFVCNYPNCLLLLHVNTLRWMFVDVKSCKCRHFCLKKESQSIKLSISEGTEDKCSFFMIYTLYVFRQLLLLL